MSFGQQSGPPASAKQVAYLLALVQKAGHSSFADARHPLDLTQRQAKGKFTTREASDLIDALVNGAGGDDTEADSPAPVGPVALSVGAQRRAAAAEERQAADRDRIVRGLPADVLADELTRRGWSVTAPI